MATRNARQPARWRSDNPLMRCGLTKKCSAAGQTHDGLEPGEQCKPPHTAGPLQRLVRPHAGDVEDSDALTESGAELEPRRRPRRWTRGEAGGAGRGGPAAGEGAADGGAQRPKSATVRGLARRRECEAAQARCGCGLTKKRSAAGQSDDAAGTGRAP